MSRYRSRYSHQVYKCPAITASDTNLLLFTGVTVMVVITQADRQTLVRTRLQQINAGVDFCTASDSL